MLRKSAKVLIGLAFTKLALTTLLLAASNASATVSYALLVALTVVGLAASASCISGVMSNGGARKRASSECSPAARRGGRYKKVVDVDMTSTGLFKSGTAAALLPRVELTYM